jgi:hypothetical protein
LRSLGKDLLRVAGYAETAMVEAMRLRFQPRNLPL